MGLKLRVNWVEDPTCEINSVVDNSAKFSVFKVGNSSPILPVYIVLKGSNSLPFVGVEGVPLWVQKLVNILLSFI